LPILVKRWREIRWEKQAKCFAHLHSPKAKARLLAGLVIPLTARRFFGLQKATLEGVALFNCP